ncbi:MAG: efflux RND transporter periplasmic adaptor subunit [Muribaculaceae bacterium]|nr:efflux RND transporter periplasmic adaptor subunit [Muribaculaceae bacterium]
MKKFFKVTMWIAVIAIFLGTFVYLFLNSRPKEVQYMNVQPSTGDIQKTTVLTGKIEPRDEIEIKPQISGIIAEVNVEPGDEVKEGDVIARIKVIPDESTLSTAHNRVTVAELDLEEKRLTYERTKSLYEKKFESREKYEQDFTAYERAKQELDAARDQLSIVKDGVSNTNAQQSNTLVRATITGLVLEVPVKVGSSVIQANTMNDGTTIAKVADMRDLLFKGKIDETEVGLLDEGMDMKISVGALPDVDLSAIIEKIAPIATEENGATTFELKGAIRTDGQVKLRAGYSANATVILSSSNNVITIPESVVEFAGDSTFVYVLQDEEKNYYKREPVELGLSDGVNVEVKNSSINTQTRLRGNEIKN